MPIDLTKAFTLLLKSAKAGHLRSQAQVGYMYTEGEGCVESYPNAVIWLEKAVARGCSRFGFTTDHSTPTHPTSGILTTNPVNLSL